jgi:hypothetical protein
MVNPKLMELTREEFLEFMEFPERTKWFTIWKQLELLERYISNTDDTLVNVCKELHKNGTL